MFKRLFNSYRNKSRQAGKFNWIIASFMENKAKHFATTLQSKSQRIPIAHMKWYLACFCAIGLTISLLSILAGTEHNKKALTVKPIALLFTKRPSFIPIGRNDFQNLLHAVRMEHYIDSLIRTARSKGQVDSILQRHRGLQDSIRLLKSLYYYE